MKIILADTHYLIAIINRLDQWHQPAIDITAKLGKAKVVVTEPVFIETLNYFSDYRPEANDTLRKRSSYFQLIRMSMWSDTQNNCSKRDWNSISHASTKATA